ncbi:hypothetical protein B9Z19DRAFT_1061566 [Tuber borchii]|uniref:Uncharacterized protein n=1 Tax=Tuber borchii TaxID=42251 RepID=A0A2T7A4K6_TUBBO|nr:hypothetical protein B9Z19DRAFT_1061566 [Tuber borchii]
MTCTSTTNYTTKPHDTFDPYPNDGYNFAASLRFPHTPRSEPLKLLRMTLPCPPRTMGDVDECAVIDPSDEDETSSVEESVGSNSPVSEEEERRAAALRNGSGPISKSSTARIEETVEEGPGMIKL